MSDDLPDFFRPEPTLTPEAQAAHDYAYGQLLGGHGVGLEELSEDWPEVLECPDVMRGWRDTAIGRNSGQ
jgi:hypothetical protein